MPFHSYTLQTLLAQQLITTACTYQCVKPSVLELHRGTNLQLARSMQREPQTPQLNWHSAFCSLVFQNTQGPVFQSPMRGISQVKSLDPRQRAGAIITGQHMWFIVELHSPSLVIKYSQELSECDAKKHQHFIFFTLLFHRMSGLTLQCEHSLLLWVYRKSDVNRLSNISTSSRALHQSFMTCVSNWTLRQTDWKHYWCTEKGKDWRQTRYPPEICDWVLPWHVPTCFKYQPVDAMSK